MSRDSIDSSDNPNKYVLISDKVKFHAYIFCVVVACMIVCSFIHEQFDKYINKPISSGDLSSTPRPIRLKTKWHLKTPIYDCFIDDIVLNEKTGGIIVKINNKDVNIDSDFDFSLIQKGNWINSSFKKK